MNTYTVYTKLLTAENPSGIVRVEAVEFESDDESVCFIRDGVPCALFRWDALVGVVKENN